MEKKYFENLDGLRFFCFLSVFLYHSFYTEYIEIKESSIYTFLKIDLFGNGNIGVNFFFVLSGFLISYLLIVEKKTLGKINLRFFWIRRILRIWPLYFFCVIFGFILFPYIKQFFGEPSNETANPIYYIFFINNFDLIKNGQPDSSILGVLWSIAIEEQFYLIWPIILSIIPLKKYWIAFLLVIITSLVYRALNDVYILHECHTLSCIGDMAVGGLGAWLILQYNKVKEFIINIDRKKIFLIYILFFVFYFFRDELLLSNYCIRIFERSLIAFFILFIILEQSYAINSFFKVGRLKKISFLGTISYGLYCFHFIGILISITLMKIFKFNSELWQVLFLETITSLIITIFISNISYKYFESFFLKFKSKFTF